MPDPVTPAKGLTLPTLGGDLGVWGQFLNGDLSLIDTALGGTLSLAVTGNSILTSVQAQYTGYKFSGTLGGNSSITWPAYSGLAVVQNNTSGGFTLTCGISGGTTVIVSGGSTFGIWSDGLNFLPLSLFAGGAASSTTGSGAIVLQTMPTIITPNLSGFITLQGSSSGASVLTAPASGGGTIFFPPGNKTLAASDMSNVTLTGDVSNANAAVTVSNLSHVTNNSLAPAGLASGYVTLGSTVMNIGAAIATSGVSGLGVINSTLVSGASGNFLFINSPVVQGTAAYFSNLVAQVPNVASLRAITAGQYPLVYTEGYTNAGDGGGNLFIWAATSTATDNSGTILQPSSLPVSGRWISVGNTVSSNLWQWGAFPGSGDVTAAFQNAITSSAGTILYVPAGTYNVSGTLTLFNSNTSIIGESQYGTIVNSTNANNSVFAISSNVGGYLLQNMSITKSVSALGGYGVLVNNNCGGVLDHLFVGNQFIGYFLGATAYSQATYCVAQSGWSHGFLFENVSGAIQTPLQWQCDHLLSQFNNGWGFYTFLNGPGTCQDMTSCTSFANVSGGFIWSGATSGCINNDVNLYYPISSFDGGNGIEFDIPGVSIMITAPFVELTGTAPTGRSLATPASSGGHGIIFQSGGASNSFAQINGGIASQNSYNGLVVASNAILEKLSVTGFQSRDNGQALVGGIQNGYSLANTSTIYSLAGCSSFSAGNTTQLYGISCVSGTHVYVVGGDYTTNISGATTVVCGAINAIGAAGIANYVSGGLTSASTISGSTITGTLVSGTSGTFVAVSGTSVTAPTVSGTTITGHFFSSSLSVTSPIVSGTAITGTTVSGTTITGVSGVFTCLNGSTYTITTSGAAHALQPTDSCIYFTNAASGLYTLPSSGAAVVGTTYGFIVVTGSNTLLVSGGPSIKIALGNQVSVSGLISSNTPYSTLSLLCVSGNLWVADSATGSWTVA